MPITHRPAIPADAAACIELRGRTRENAFSVAQLAALGITTETLADGIATGRLPGHVAKAEGQIVGFTFGDRRAGEILVLALLPEWEGQGLGKALLTRMVDDFRSWGFPRLFLGSTADPAARSHGFYRHLGWRPTGETDALGDEILELRLGSSCMELGARETTPPPPRKVSPAG